MWKMIKDWPSLTELFFGKGKGPSDEPKRARNKGKFVGDDKSTADVNEAWEGGKAPTKKAKVTKKPKAKKPTPAKKKAVVKVTKPKAKKATAESKPKTKKAPATRGTRKDYALDKKLKEIKKNNGMMPVKKK